MRQNSVRRAVFSLTRESIDAASVHIEKLLEGITTRRDALRIRLAAEEVLHNWGTSLGEEVNCTILYSSRFGQRSLRLMVSGPNTNPGQCEEDAELDAAGDFILERLGLASLSLPGEVQALLAEGLAVPALQMLWGH